MILLLHVPSISKRRDSTFLNIIFILDFSRTEFPPFSGSLDEGGVHADGETLVVSAADTLLVLRCHHAGARPRHPAAATPVPLRMVRPPPEECSARVAAPSSEMDMVGGWPSTHATLHHQEGGEPLLLLLVYYVAMFHVELWTLVS